MQQQLPRVGPSSPSSSTNHDMQPRNVTTTASSGRATFVPTRISVTEDATQDVAPRGTPVAVPATVKRGTTTRAEPRVVRGDDAPPPSVLDRSKRKLHSLWTPKNSDHRSEVLGQLERMALATKDAQPRELPRVILPKERRVRQQEQRS